MDFATNEKTTVSKFKVQDKTLYALIHWKENGSCMFEMKICDENTVWYGSFSPNSTDIEEIGETEEEYYTNVKAALTHESAMYSHVFTVYDEAAKLSWKRHHKDAVLILHGIVSLRKAQEVTKDVLVPYLYEENKKLHENAGLNASEINTLKERLEEVTKELEHLVNMRVETEHDLYGKFVKLLNAKKRRIEVLEENLTNFAKGDD